MADLRYEGVRKVFDGGTVAMDDVTLEVRDGEFMVFVGPSGSGKSTFLRVMAGLEEPTAGRILVGGRDMTDAEPRERDLAMVFQAYALYPHKTVRENLEFGLRMRGMDSSERGARVTAIAGTLGITGLLDRKPGQLSGGQRQRVALGRALVREPKAFLLDEPLSNLDPGLRLGARAELARLHRKLGATFLYVTHDQEEAMTLGDRVAVLREGRVQQVAPPLELYRRPANRFVAEFIGSPSMNVYRCSVAPGRSAEGLRLEGPGFGIEVDGALPADLPGEVWLGVRPHDVEPLPPEGTSASTPGRVGSGRSEDDTACVTGEVELVEPRGSDLLVRLRLSTESVLGVVLSPDVEVAEGQPLSVRLPPGRLHFFDPDDGSRIPR